MPLVGIQRRAWTATTLLPTFSAADANSLEIVSSIEFAMSSKTPFLNCESRIEDGNGRRIPQMARWKPESWLDKPLETCEEGAPATGSFERCADHLSRKHSANHGNPKIVPREGLPTIHELTW